jgi:hypothetical protein
LDDAEPEPRKKSVFAEGDNDDDFGRDDHGGTMSWSRKLRTKERKEKKKAETDAERAAQCVSFPFVYF